MTVSTLDKTGYYFLLLYALASSISIAGANFGISFALLFALIRYTKEPFRPQIDKGVVTVICLFWLTMLVSAVFSIYSHSIAFSKLWAYIYRTLPFFLAVYFIKSRQQLYCVLATMAASILIADYYAIWQGLHGNHRAQAFSSHPMILAGFLLQMIPLLLVVGIEDKNFSRYGRYIFGIIVVVSLMAALYNGTRGAWISILFVLILYCLLIIRTNTKVASSLGLFGVVILIVTYFFPGGPERVASIADMENQSNYERLLLWQSAWQMFKDYPLVGVGLGNFGYVYQERYISPEAQERLGHAHNNFLHILADNGILGFAGFMLMLLYILYFLWKRYSRDNSPIALGVFLATLALLVQGLTEFNFGDSAVIRMFWFLLGLTMAEAKLSSAGSTGAGSGASLLKDRSYDATIRMHTGQE